MQICKDCLRETDEVWPPRESENACKLDPLHNRCEECGKDPVPCYRVTHRDGKKVKFEYPISCICGDIHMPPLCHDMFYALKATPCERHKEKFEGDSSWGFGLSCSCGLARHGVYLVGRNDNGPGMGLVLDEDPKKRARQLHMINKAYYVGLQSRVLRKGESIWVINA